ncbi:MAG: hypothetical protein ACPIOQ_78305, partial [Promethearchaeia archaeon]
IVGNVLLSTLLLSLGVAGSHAAATPGQRTCCGVRSRSGARFVGMLCEQTNHWPLSGGAIIACDRGAPQRRIGCAGERRT